MDKFTITEKFEFFFIGLIFTLLGAAIQTANFADASEYALLIEVSGIIGLLVSGFTGINKLEWLPNLLHASDVVEKKAEKDLEEWAKARDNLLNRHLFKNKIQRWGFYIGLSLILIGRTLDQILNKL